MGGTPVPLAGPAELTRTGISAWPGRVRSFGLQRRGYLLTVGVLIVAGGLSALLQGRGWHQAPVLSVVNVTTTLAFICTGLLLRRQPGQQRVAWALMLAGAFRSLDFANSLADSGPWPLYALVCGGLDRLAGAYAMLRYPRPALLRHQRAYLVILAGWMLIGRSLIAVTSRPEWNGNPRDSWWPALWPHQGLMTVISDVVNVGEGVLGITLVVLLGLRLARTTGLDRLVITPIIVSGLAAVIAASVTAVATLMTSLNSDGPNTAYTAEGIVDLAVPLAFLIAAIQSGLLLRNIAGLAAQVSSGADVDGVRYALRAALRDPTLEVLELSAVGSALAAGAAAATGAAGAGAGAAGPPGPGAGAGGAGGLALAQPPDRLVELIRTEGGAPIAVIIADPGLARYRGLFNAAVQTSGLALQNAQLQARAARAELSQVRASRARLVEAGLAERRRLERDLHDGAQQHLLALAAQLTAAMTRTSDPVATAAFRQARLQLGAILAELRNLAHGIHPAVLTQGGLAAALEDVAERMPLPVRVAVPAVRVAPAVEATAYFVVCEALANVVKHAGASAAAVTVRADGSGLSLEISDDGVGGAGPAGQGLANMQDRVRALDGEITIDSPPGLGTRVLVRIPCG
jgi:signal transduction histidine kinase